MDLFKSSGKLEYRNEGWVTLIPSSSIGRYYRWWVEKTIHQKTNVPMKGWHITVVAGKYEDCSLHPAWKKHENEIIEFEYDHNVVDDFTSYWLTIYSRRLEEIRLELGLYPFPKFPFHLTVANLKNL
jgi:hypothetical protein